MQDQEKKAHAMTSFALFGGLFASPRQKNERPEKRTAKNAKVRQSAAGRPNV
ncbi:hypothetical protein ABAC402_14565 [Asticcacaulis sp. AC402]|nr:hypothetical protein ABAC402_14565 [Asticcacaulis sp. AC402]